MKIHFTYLFILLFISNLSQATTIMEVDDVNDACLFTGKYVDYLEDPSQKLTIYDVISPPYNNKFKSGEATYIVPNEVLTSTYWMRLTILENGVTDKNWVVELYEFRIDFFEIYIPDGHGDFYMYDGGADFKFGNKDYKHKNFIYDLPLEPNKPLTIYYKIKARRPVFLIGMVRSFQRVLEYATTEYFMLAMFYGVVLAMALFNLFLFFSTYDFAYFYYVLYVLSVGIFGLTQDGLGFEYLWPNQPFWNDYMPPISTYSMILWAILYARSFLNTKKLLPAIDKGIIYFLYLRTLIFIASFYLPQLSQENLVNIIPLFYLYIAGIIAWKNGNRVARFYVLAFTMLFIGFTLSVLNNTHIITASPVVVYGFNIGVLCEMILLSLALADRIKVLTLEKEEAQKQIIVQFEEKEHLKDELNKELEEKVLERTRELENKNKELDTFVYRSSHDIKGPLKSIIGLASVAQLDVKDEESRNYFDHILKTSKRLDDVVDHLMEVMEIKESKLKITHINFEELIQKVIQSYKSHPHFSKISTSVSVNQKNDFYSDERLLQPVVENIIENAIKYADLQKTDSYIKVNVEINNGKALMHFSDNGIGIEKNLQEKIFDMFYEINPESSSNGIGLYKTKICIDKLQGSMELRSEEGIGTNFTIQIKNYK